MIRNSNKPNTLLQKSPLVLRKLQELGLKGCKARKKPWSCQKITRRIGINGPYNTKFSQKKIE